MAIYFLIIIKAIRCGLKDTIEKKDIKIFILFLILTLNYTDILCTQARETFNVTDSVIYKTGLQ